MDALEAIASFLKDRELAPRKVLVAVSGGVDSTALLVAMNEQQAFAVEAVHVNHHLRGEAADGDERWVRALCERLSVPLHVCDGTLPEGIVREIGIEAAARRLRYSLLLELRNRTGAELVATAHQQNDQAETVLLRLASGRGPERLQGIQPITEDGIIRPLLGVQRRDLESFVNARGIQPRVDESNSDPRFVRNRIRSELLPLLKSINPRIVELLADTAELTRLQNKAFGKLLDTNCSGAIEKRRRETVFHLERLDPDRYLRAAILLREIVRLDAGARNISSARLQEITMHLGSECRRSITRDLELVGDATTATLRVVQRVEPRAFDVALTIDHPVTIGDATISLSQASDVKDYRRNDGKLVSQVFELPDDVAPAFSLRNRRRGDRFQPLGLSAPKSLKDFLIDRKVDARRRDTLPLLLCNNEIVWIAGVEVSDRYKVTGSSRPLFEIKVEYHAGVVDERSRTVLRS